jgi:DNA-binding LytR/AlgR family response regulator
MLKDKEKIIVSRILKDIEEKLEEYLFLRVHHSLLLT